MARILRRSALLTLMAFFSESFSFSETDRRRKCASLEVLDCLEEGVSPAPPAASGEGLEGVGEGVSTNGEPEGLLPLVEPWEYVDSRGAAFKSPLAWSLVISSQMFSSE